MVLVFDVKKYGFIIIREIWFADFPVDIKGAHSIAFYSCKRKNNLNHFRCVPFPTLIIDLSQDLNAIWRRFDRKSTRYMISRAIREGIQVKVNTDWDEFYILEKNFRARKHLPPVDPVPSKIRGHGVLLFTAYLDGELVAGHLYLYDDRHIRWLRAASKRFEMDKRRSVLVGCANRLLIWEAIKHAKNKGIQEFDMGGYYIGSPNEELERINAFKKSFGGVITMKYNCFKDYSIIYGLAKKFTNILRQYYLYRPLQTIINSQRASLVGKIKG